MDAVTEQVPQSPAHLVAGHRVADASAHGEPDPRRFVHVITALQVKDHMRPSGAIAAPDGPGELFSPPHPVR